MSETSPYDAGVAHSAGELAKSVGRLSVAVSVLAARQVGSLMSSDSTLKDRGAASIDDVTSVAGGHLSGALRTAYAVGTNVQSGLVDAMFDVAGFGQQGNAPTGDTSGLAIAMMARVQRRVTGVRTVASGALSRSVPQSELVQRLTQYHTESTGGQVEREKAVLGLWKSEGLSTSVGKHFQPDNTLADPALPPNVLPIAHVGFGSGSTEALVFDVEKLNAHFAANCHPSYVGFSYEGVGAILRIYERGLFKVMSGALGLVALDAPDGPDPEGFFAAYLARYPADIQRLIAHGYGRIVAFSNIDIYAAIRRATAFPPERVEPAVHGCGFAFAFMNSADLPRILEHSAIPFDADVRAAFQNGLVYSLVFFDWYAPGLLDGWASSGPLESELVDLARLEAEASRRRGFLLPFHLEHPRG